MVRFRFEFGYFGSQFGFLVSEVQGAFGYFKIQLGFGFGYFGFRFGSVESLWSVFIQCFACHSIVFFFLCI